MNHGRTETWRERFAALEWRPDTFVVMARLFNQLAKDLTPAQLTKAGNRLRPDTFKAADWERAYATVPSVLGQLTVSITPELSAQAPTQEQPGWGQWVRETLTQIEATVRRLEAMTDAKTGLFTNEILQGAELKRIVARAEQQADAIIVELKAVADNLASVMQTGRLMSEWLKLARAGDAEALRWVLSVNPGLSYHPEIATRLQATTAAQDHTELAKLAHALKQELRPPKHATVGLILIVLWEAGLKRLSYKQIRGFLKSAGLEGLPTAQALERYAQRLGLKKYVWEDETTSGQR
ncbi:MAG: hypothetical protein AB7F94_05175 [Nitrospira sp.]